MVKNRNAKDKVKAKEFRHNKARSGHPAYITEIVIESQKPPKKKARFIGITEHPETYGEINVPLDKNPDSKNRGKKAYLRPNVDEVELTKKTFGKKLKDWSFVETDKPKVKIIISNDKKKR